MQRFFSAFAAIMIGLAMTGAARAPSAKPLGGASPAHAPRAQPLGVTLDFVRAKIAQQGAINYAGSIHDSTDNQSWVNKFSVEATEVTADAPGCAVHFHWRTSVDDQVSYDGGATISFRKVTSVDLISMEEDMRRISANAGHPTWTPSVEPSIWVVLAHENDGATDSADFRDRDTAERVAKAMRHAATLCGGTKSEAF